MRLTALMFYAAYEAGRGHVMMLMLPACAVLPRLAFDPCGAFRNRRRNCVFRRRASRLSAR
jgi:hypothetical protein